MSNQHTQGYSKNFVERYHKIPLSFASKEQIRKHYEYQGYIDAIITHPDDEDKKFTVPLPLTKIKAGYGDRYYIQCMQCGKRVTYLLCTFTKQDGRDAVACACRHCFNVNYISQQATKNDVDYNYHMIRKIGRRLDPDFTVDDYFNYPMCPFKPKYMRQTTYNKLRIKFYKHVREGNEKHRRMLGILVNKNNRYIN